MNSFENKRRCPHCLKPLHEESYLMSREAPENVLSLTQIAWIVCAVVVLVLLAELL